MCSSMPRGRTSVGGSTPTSCRKWESCSWGSSRSAGKPRPSCETGRPQRRPLYKRSRRTAMARCSRWPSRYSAPGLRCRLGRRQWPQDDPLLALEARSWPWSSHGKIWLPPTSAASRTRGHLNDWLSPTWCPDVGQPPWLPSRSKPSWRRSPLPRLRRTRRTRGGEAYIRHRSCTQGGKSRPVVEELATGGPGWREPTTPR